MERLYAIVDTATLRRRGVAPRHAAEALLDAGVRLMQYRHKGPYTRAVFEEASTIARLAEKAGARLIIDDRADVARLLGAGVHVGQTDLPPRELRRVFGRDLVIGYSTHNESQFAIALDEPVDYLAIGPVFPTVSKENPDEVVGVERVRTMRALTRMPLAAIGGITRENAPYILGAGVDTLAVIGDLYPEPATPASIRARAGEWLRRLTTVL